MKSKYLLFAALLAVAGMLATTNSADAQKGGGAKGGGGSKGGGGGGKGPPAGVRPAPPRPAPAPGYQGGAYRGNNYNYNNSYYRGYYPGFGIGIGLSAPFYPYSPYAYDPYIVGPRVTYYSAPTFEAPPQPAPTNAQIRVLVPDPQAKVWFDGASTSQDGTDRLYHTPDLTAGANNTYRIRVSWTQAGKEMIQERVVPVGPGRLSTADFTQPIPEDVAPPPAAKD